MKKITSNPALYLSTIAVLALVSACSRGEFKFAEALPSPVQADVATQEEIYVASQRERGEGLSTFGKERQPEMGYYKGVFSIPKDRQKGRIQWPKGKPKAAKHFMIIDRTIYDHITPFKNDVIKDAGEFSEVLVFVHGYNTNAAEATYRLAQIVKDFNVPIPAVSYAWPSSGTYRGYVYDRDSAAFARDGLEELLRDLTTGTGKRVILVGHSMGGYLVMETLRQMAIRDNRDMRRRISEVALLSPDIDQDLFEAQLDRIGRLPKAFSVYAAKQDSALRLSSILTGKDHRLGNNLEDLDALRARGINVVDQSQLDRGAQSNHTITMTSPTSILAIIDLIEKRKPPKFIEDSKPKNTAETEKRSEGLTNEETAVVPKDATLPPAEVIAAVDIPTDQAASSP